MACSNILEIAPDSPVRLASWVISKLSVKEHVHKRKMVRRAISQLLYLQIVMLIVDSEYARYILSLHKTGLCYKQPLNNCIYTACEYSFEMNPFCHASTKVTCQ